MTTTPESTRLRPMLVLLVLSLALLTGCGGSGSSSSSGSAGSGGSGEDMSCSDFMQGSAEDRVDTIAGLASSRGFDSDRETVVSWERAAYTQCEINGGSSVAAYVGNDSGIVPDTGDSAAGVAKPY